jgi:hypothetical protein
MAVKSTLRIVEGGLLWGGVPCSSVVFMNLSNMKRTAGGPLGDQSFSAAIYNLHFELVANTQL